MIEDNFVNELGNKITIKVKNKKDTGTNYKTGKEHKFTGVSISIIGPTSETENVVTREEAIHLLNALQEHLFP